MWSALCLTSNHVAIRASRRHHRIDVLLGVDRNMNQTRTGRLERFRQRGNWVFDASQIDRVEIEAPRDRNEVGSGAELGRAKTLAIKKLLLLAHQPQPLVVEDR